MFGFIGAGEPGEFGPVEFDFLVALDLIEIVRRIDRDYGQAVRFRNPVGIIGRHDAAGCRHILHDHAGISRDVLADMIGEQSAVHVICGSGAGTNDERDRLALIVRSLRRRVNSRK